MANQNNIQDELRDMNSNLPTGTNQSPFSVPNGYFDGLAASVLAKIKGESNAVTDELQSLSPLLAGIPKRLPYSLPDGYFEENLSVLPFLLKDEQPAALLAIGKKNPYTVPAGYFEQFPQQVMAALPKPEAKVVPLFGGSWMRVAAAAVIGGIIFVGGYQLLNRPTTDLPTVTATTTPDTSGSLLARNEASEVTREIKTATTKDLDEFIKTVPLIPAKTEEAPATEVTNLLKDVSEKDIDAFLEQIPTTDEELLVTN